MAVPGIIFPGIIDELDMSANAQAPHLRVTVVSVCFNSAAVIGAMLDSLPSGTPAVLVDNGSGGLSAGGSGARSDGGDMVAAGVAPDRGVPQDQVAALAALAMRHGARLIRNAANRGFGPACNQGAALADTEFLLFLNPDARLDPGALEALVAAADRNPRAVAMNPRIVDGRGRPYFKHRSVLLARREWRARGWPPADSTVPVLSGAVFFVRRADFEAVGGFDPMIFLYHEDDDLSLRLAARQGSLLFVRDAVARHLEGRSSSRNPAVAALKAWHMGRSRVYAARKHGRPFPFARAFARALSQLLSPVAWISARKRAKHRAFLRGVVSGRVPGPVGSRSEP